MSWNPLEYVGLDLVLSKDICEELCWWNILKYVGLDPWASHNIKKTNDDDIPWHILV